MSYAPHPPAASQRPSVSPLVRFGRVVAALGLLSIPGCYEGPRHPGGVPWDGHADDGDDAAGDDDLGESDGSAGDDGFTSTDGGGGFDDGGGAADDGGTPPPADSGADDGSADGGTPPPGDDGGADTGEPPPADVPDNAYCQEVASWDATWTQREDEILTIVNEVRSQGANCGSQGSFGPAGPLTMHPALRCAARKHSKNMADLGFFDHTNPAGQSPWDRMAEAGYDYSYAGENIAAGNSTAAATMQQWMDSDGHCANIMNPDFSEIGVGYYPGGQWGHLWTQAFASP